MFQGPSLWSLYKGLNYFPSKVILFIPETGNLSNCRFFLYGCLGSGSGTCGHLIRIGKDRANHLPLRQAVQAELQAGPPKVPCPGSRRNAMTYRHVLLTLFCLSGGLTAGLAQTEIHGRVIDAFTREPVPYAYVSSSNDTAFAFSDDDGFFTITVNHRAHSLTAMHSGYLSETVSFRHIEDLFIQFELTASAEKMTGEADVSGMEAAESFIRKIFDNRQKNNPVLNDFYAYSTYEKLQFDLNDITEDIKNKAVLRPFRELLDNADSTAGNLSPTVPFFFTESVADVYHRVRPLQKAEVVRASRSVGVENLTLIQLLKDIYRNVSVYDEYINVFGKSYINPLSPENLKYYRYAFSDSTYIDGRKCYQIDFHASRKNRLTFTGSVWFHDTTFALQRITLALDNANWINFVDDMVFVKVYKCIGNLQWVPDHEQVIVNFSRKEKGMHVSARKSKWYSNHRIGTDPGDSVFKAHAYIQFDPRTFDRQPAYWNVHRTEFLTPREEQIFDLVDTLKTMPAFQIYVATVAVALTGHVPVGRFDVGPYYHLLSENEVEGYRVRIGGRTNDKFSRHWRFEGYGAYGFRDRRFKFMSGVRYTLRHKPFIAAGYQYKQDLVQPGLHESTFKDEGFIVVLFRRNPTDELAKVIGHKAYFDAAFRFGLAVRAQYLNNFYRPESVHFDYFTDAAHALTNDHLHVSEIWLNLRYSYQEKFIEKKDKRVSLGTDYPVFHLNLIKGLPGFLDGEFNYLKLAGRITHRVNLFPAGHLNYLLEAGNVFGTVPYPLLYVQRGNESRIYDYTAFNLMFHYEFIADRYFIAAAEHHLDGYLWRRLPLLRRLDWRELVTARVLTGSVSHRNKDLLVDPTVLEKLDKTPYVEAGVGLENLLRFFRLDAIWRLTYRDDPSIPLFGVRLSAKLVF